MVILIERFPEINVTPRAINVTSDAVLGIEVEVTRDNWEKACEFELDAQFLGFISSKEELILTISKL
jgi:hypothetical protein